MIIAFTYHINLETMSQIRRTSLSCLAISYGLHTPPSSKDCSREMMNRNCKQPSPPRRKRRGRASERDPIPILTLQDVTPHQWDTFDSLLEPEKVYIYIYIHAFNSSRGTERVRFHCTPSTSRGSLHPHRRPFCFRCNSNRAQTSHPHSNCRQTREAS